MAIRVFRGKANYSGSTLYSGVNITIPAVDTNKSFCKVLYNNETAGNYQRQETYARLTSSTNLFLQGGYYAGSCDVSWQVIEIK